MRLDPKKVTSVRYVTISGRGVYHAAYPPSVKGNGNWSGKVRTICLAIRKNVPSQNYHTFYGPPRGKRFCLACAKTLILSGFFTVVDVYLIPAVADEEPVYRVVLDHKGQYGSLDRQSFSMTARAASRAGFDEIEGWNERLSGAITPSWMKG